MSEESEAGVCRCLGSPNGRLISKFVFEFGEVQVFYCRLCDSVTTEVLGFPPEHFPEHRVFDVLSDFPGDRCVLVLNAGWVISMANILSLCAEQ
jgi:hypothetical protein